VNGTWMGVLRSLLDDMKMGWKPVLHRNVPKKCFVFFCLKCVIWKITWSNQIHCGPEKKIEILNYASLHKIVNARQLAKMHILQ
jgi:hypothetical protein